MFPISFVMQATFITLGFATTSYARLAYPGEMGRPQKGRASGSTLDGFTSVLACSVLVGLVLLFIVRVALASAGNSVAWQDALLFIDTIIVLLTLRFNRG